ncbi:MAG: DUF1707 domain-containing protein [Actinomycetes bacterium]
MARALGDAHAEGRLTAEELHERLDAAYQADLGRSRSADPETFRR